MRAWQFGKPKTPGFGISSAYYLSVLSSHATLPAILEIANPKGEGGALEAFGVPLVGESDKSALGRPLERGAYGVISKDQKTALQLVVVSKEEAGFNPEPIVHSVLAEELSPEALARIRGTWSLCQLRFKSHDPMVAPALDLLLGTAVRLATLSEGVVADAVSQRYLLPEQVLSSRRLLQKLPIYAEEHVAIKLVSRPDGIHAFTLGLQKFLFHELEILNLMEGDGDAAASALLWVSQQILLGVKVGEGYQVGAPNMPFEVREGALDRKVWGDTPAYELLPPTTVSASEAIQAWSEEIRRTGQL